MCYFPFSLASVFFVRRDAPQVDHAFSILMNFWDVGKKQEKARKKGKEGKKEKKNFRPVTRVKSVPGSTFKIAVGSWIPRPEILRSNGVSIYFFASDNQVIASVASCVNQILILSLHGNLLMIGLLC